MKESIKELGSLCKLAAELERKWDRAGKDYLSDHLSNAEYAARVENYLDAVRRLEIALSRHLVVLTAEASNARRSLESPPEDAS